MKLLTFAAGLAAGYVIGSRAGREAYDSIVAQVRQARSHPTVVQAQEKAKEVVSSKVHDAASSQSKTSAGTPGPVGDGLA